MDERTILTAAHCFLGECPEDQSKMRIIVGANQPTNTKLNKKRKRGISRRKIKSVKIHPLYDNVLFSAKYDLALVEIKGKFRFRQSIWPICIPEKVRPREYHFEKGYTLVGFGKDTNSPDTCDDFECLKQDQLNAQRTEYCSAIYGQILSSPFDPFYELIQNTLPKNFDEEDSLICAGIPGQNAGTCPGDSGGILMKSKFDLESGLIATQQAVVYGSGANCDGMRFPSIFVRLDNSEVLPWIFENVFPSKGPEQQDCQENDGNDNANVGARSTTICQNERDDENRPNVSSRCFVTEFISDQKKACVFPFKLQGRATEDQNSCTNLFDPDGRYWCSTQVIF